MTFSKSMQPKLLMVAFHFPPIKGSSGLERTLGNCRGLSRLGWKPIVLSAASFAYESVSRERIADIPPDVLVRRGFALDAARHLSIRGRYPGWAAYPDRWVSWLLGALPLGMVMAIRHKPKVIWTTYPIATAHLVGYFLHRMTGIPWVADFRDPMVEFDSQAGQHFPANPTVRSIRLWIERKCASHAAAMVFCTDGARKIFEERHGVLKGRLHVIPNGYDEAAFAGISNPRGDDVTRHAASGAVPKYANAVTLLHSGTLYPGPDRDPTAFFHALRSLLQKSPGLAERLRIVLRATGHDSVYAPLIESLGLTEVVSLRPALPYRDALREMIDADGLLIFQGRTSNPAIPAKLYEYFRARRPILAMANAEGNTAALLREEGVGNVVELDDSSAIEEKLAEFLDAIVRGTAPTMAPERVKEFERGKRAEDLARLLIDFR